MKYFNGDNLASSTWASKYKQVSDKTPEDMHLRMAKEFYRIDKKYQKEQSKENLSEYGKFREELTEDQIFKYFDRFKYIIPQGSVMSTLGTDMAASLSNCFVAESPLDSYPSINKTDGELISYFVRRCGVGIDISNLRPNTAPTNNTAKQSTGAVSFMHRFSHTTREVAQGGRRGALMISMDGNHPDIKDFATVKSDRTSVTGANISMKISNMFMEAVENNDDYILRFPIDLKINLSKSEIDELPYEKLIEFNGGYIKKINSEEYWKLYMKQARNHAEPGIMFWDNVLNYDPAAVYDEYMPISSNPCFTGDMELLTEDGYVNFSNLVDSDIKLKNELGEIVNGKVWSNGIKDINAVRLSSGKIIKSTPDHRFKLIDETEEISKNLKGKQLMPYIKIPVYNDLMTKLGFIQGDASITDINKNRKLGFTIHIGKKDDDILKLFDFERNGRHYYTTDYVKYLYEYGFNITTLPNRNLPSEYKNLNKKEKLSFLQGLYSANGSIISKTRISFKTTCHKLAEELVDALKEFEIYAYITTNKAKVTEFDNGEYLCKESYDVNIQKYESMLLFANNIGFVHEYKNDALKQLLMLKSPKVTSVKNIGKEEVFDFNLNSDNHWGVVEGRVVHNCGEQFLNANDSCRLIAINLLSFVEKPYTNEAYFNKDKFYEVVYEAMRLGDNLIDLEVEYIDRIIAKIQSDPEPFYIKDRDLELWAKSKDVALAGRRIGLGITALGDTFAALGATYGSDKSLEITEEIFKHKMLAELDATIDLSIQRGHFKGWDKDKEYLQWSYGADGEFGANQFYTDLDKNFPEQVKRMNKYSRRNVSWSTVAPTGSVSIVAQVTSGLEPLFSPYFTRRKKVNPGDETVRIDFVDENGDSWEEYPVLHYEFEQWIKNHCGEDISNLSVEKVEELYTKSPWYKSIADDIDWTKRVEIQGIIQKYTTNAISSTVNLPSTVTEDEVNTIYTHAWKKGLKGITTYTDGSRAGVLVKNNNTNNKFKERPDQIECKVLRFRNEKKQWIAFIGLNNGDPYEIFTGINDLDAFPVPSYVENGYILKVSTPEGSRYDFKYEDNYGYTNIVGGLNRIFSKEYWNYARFTSALMREGVEITNIIKIIDKLEFTNKSLNSWQSGVVRSLSVFIKDGTKSEGSTCEECGSDEVHYMEGCLTCMSCGSSKCG